VAAANSHKLIIIRLCFPSVGVTVQNIGDSNRLYAIFLSPLGTHRAFSQDLSNFDLLARLMVLTWPHFGLEAKRRLRPS